MNFPIFKYDELISTNTELSRLISLDLEEFSVVITDFQTSGRGQMGASWESERGANLLFSKLFYPHFIAIKDFFLLSQFSSLAILDFLNHYFPSSDFSIKWPNDIYYADKKIAGILIENSIQGSFISSSIIGIGLNVNQLHFHSDAPNPISLSAITGVHYTLSSLFTDLNHFLHLRYQQLLSGDFTTIRSDYQKHLYRYNQLYLYEDNSGQFQAVLDSVANDGKLNLRLTSGEIRSYYFKEVRFLI